MPGSTEPREIGVELVEIGLFFLNVESRVLQRYEGRLANEAMPGVRPAYKNVSIRLQIAVPAAIGSRPHPFPRPSSCQADLIVAEFAELVRVHRNELLPHSACLLKSFRSLSGNPAFPALLRHFDAIILNQIREEYPGRHHPDDPVIDLRSTTQYSEAEIGTAVERALRSKNKGSCYSTDLLVLHTLQSKHKPYFPSTGMHVDEIVRLGRAYASLSAPRFKEVWFLNAYADSQGKRLYRLL